MYKILAIVLIAFLPICTGLNCYACASGATGCNDPFSSTATNVTQTGSISLNTYCVKTALTSSFVSRYGSPTCTAISFVLGIGTACCQTDLCNAAPANYTTPILVILSFLVMLFKSY